MIGKVMLSIVLMSALVVMVVASPREPTSSYEGSGGVDTSQQIEGSGGYNSKPYTEYAGTYTEVTHQSYLSSIGDSFLGAFIGVLLFIAAHALLWWNEGRTLRRETALETARSMVRSISAEKGGDDSADGSLVHAVGRAQSNELLEDVDIGLSGETAVNALKMKRSVELFQWTEKSTSQTDKHLGGSKTTVTQYRYEKEWTSQPINSAAYKNPPQPANPTAKPLPDREITAANISFGRFRLSPSQIAQIKCTEKLSLPASVIQTTVQSKFRGSNVHIVGNNQIYLGHSPNNPQIGDARITYTVATPQIISVIAQLRGETFAPFVLNGGESIDLLQTGTHTAGAMIDAEQSSNSLLKWALRLCGFLLMWIASMLTAAPIETVASIIPFIGDIVGSVSATATFMLCIPLSMLTISIAWIYYRPRVGIVLLIGALVALWLVRGSARQMPAVSPVGRR